jgi:OmpA-OmpF porin, OOP family
MPSSTRSFVPSFLVSLVLASPVLAQNPGDPDADGCKDLKVLTRLSGCTISACTAKAFDGTELVVGLTAEGETRRPFEGKIESVTYFCPARYSPLQIARNAENALKAAGFKPVVAAKPADSIYVTQQNGPHWVQVRAEPFNDISTYEITSVLTQAMAQEMEASAETMAAEIAKSGRVSVYGINFDTGSAKLKPESDKVLGEVLSLLQKNAAWRIRVEGHTDNVGQKAANLALSNQRAGAVVTWLTAKGISATRLTSQGFGDSKPLGGNDTDEGRAKNRRVELVKQ